MRRWLFRWFDKDKGFGKILPGADVEGGLQHAGPIFGTRSLAGRNDFWVLSKTGFARCPESFRFKSSEALGLATWPGCRGLALRGLRSESFALPS